MFGRDRYEYENFTYYGNEEYDRDDYEEGAERGLYYDSIPPVQQPLQPKLNRDDFLGQIAVLKKVTKEVIGPVEIAVISEDEFHDVESVLNYLLTKNCEVLASTQFECLIPFIYCENLEIAAKSQIILTDFKIPIPIFNTNPITDVEPPKVLESYVDYVKRVVVGNYFEDIHKYRMKYNQNVVPTAFLNAQKLLDLSCYETNVLLDILKDSNSCLLAFHYIRQRLRNPLMVEVLEEFVCQTLVPNPQSLLLSFENEIPQHTETTNEIVHLCLKCLKHNPSMNLKSIQELVPMIKTFNERIIVDLFILLFRRKYNEQIALLAKDCIAEKLTKGKTKLSIELLKYVYLSPEYSQNIQTFCINFLMDALKKESDCNRIKRILITLKTTGLNDFFKNSFEESINSIKSNVEKCESPLVLYCNYLMLDLLIQSSGFYQDQRVIPLYHLICEKIVETYEETTQHYFDLGRKCSQQLIFPYVGFIPFCVDYLKKNEKEFDLIPNERFIMKGSREFNKYENICLFSTECLKEMNITCCDFGQIKELFALPLTPYCMVKFIEMYNNYFRRELLEIAIESASQDIQTAEKSTFTSLKLFYKLFFKLHLIYAKAPKGDQQRTIPGDKISSIVFKYVKLLFNDLRGRKEEEIRNILRSTLQINLRRVPRGSNALKSSSTVFSDRIAGMHAVIVALIKDTISGLEENSFALLLRNKVEEDCDSLLFYFFNSVDREQLALDNWSKRLLEIDYSNKMVLLERCIKNKLTESVPFNMAVETIFKTKFHLDCVDSYQLKVLSLLKETKENIMYLVEFLEGITEEPLDKSNVVIFGKELDGKFPLNVVNYLNQTIREKWYIEKIQEKDIGTVVVILKYGCEKINAAEVFEIFGTELGKQIIKSAITNEIPVQKLSRMIEEIGHEECSELADCCFAFPIEELEKMSQEEIQRMTKSWNGNERNFYGYISGIILKQHIKIGEVKPVEFFDIDLEACVRFFSIGFFMKKECLLEIIETLKTMFYKKKESVEYLYVLLYMLFKYQENDYQTVLIKALEEMKDIILDGYYFIPSIRKIIKDLLKDCLIDNVLSDKLKLLNVVLFEDETNDFTNADFIILKENYKEGITSISLPFAEREDSHFANTIKLNRKLEEILIKQRKPIKVQETNHGIRLEDLMKKNQESISVIPPPKLPKQSKTFGGAKTPFSFGSTSQPLSSISLPPRNEISINSLTQGNTSIGGLTVPPPPSFATRPVNDLPPPDPGFAQNLSKILSASVTQKKTKPEYQCLDDTSFYQEVETNDESVPKAFEYLDQKGILGIPYDKLKDEDKKQMTPFIRTFIKHYEDFGVDLVEVKEEIAGSSEMKEMWKQIQAIQIEKIGGMKELIMLFIDSFDKKDNEMMRNVLDYLLEEGERIDIEEEKDGKKEIILFVITILKGHCRIEQKEETKKEQEREMIDVQGLGRVPVPPEWDMGVMRSLPIEILRDNIEEYYHQHPLKRNERNNSELNIAIIQKAKRHFEDSAAKKLGMQNKYRNEKYGKGIRRDRLNETDFSFDFDEAIEMLVESNKRIGKGIKKRIVTLSLIDTNISENVLQNLIIHIFKKQLKEINERTNEKQMRKILELLLIIIKLYKGRKNANVSNEFIKCISDGVGIFFKDEKTFGIIVKGMILFRECIQCCNQKLIIEEEESIYRFISNEGKINQKDIDVFSGNLIELGKTTLITQKKVEQFSNGEIVNEEELWNFIERLISLQITAMMLFVDYKKLKELLKKLTTEVRIKIVYGIFTLLNIGGALQSEVEEIFEETQNKVKKMLRNQPEMLQNELRILIKYPKYLPFEMKLLNLKKLMKGTKSNEIVTVKVNRTNVIATMINSTSKLNAADWKKTFRIEFEGEQGGDNGGLLKECYTLFGKEINEGKMELFSCEDNVSLIPNPRSNADDMRLAYEFIGKMIGKIIMDEVTVNIHFNEAFVRLVLGLTNKLENIDCIDSKLGEQMRKVLNENVSQWGLTFVMNEIIDGKTVEVELKPEGKETEVTEQNKTEYVNLYIHHKFVRRISKQSIWVSVGLFKVIDSQAMKQFTPQEIDLLLCGNEIDLIDLKKNVVYDKYNNTSVQIQWFWEIIEEYGREDKVKLLQFVTGQSRAPVGGFTNLKTSNGEALPFTIASIKYDNPDEKLPTAHTCANRLEIPLYSTKEIMEQKLMFAISECINYEFV